MKMAKKNQSLIHDLPVFGLNTIRQLDACKIKFVCLHAINCKLAESLIEIESALLISGINLLMREKRLCQNIGTLSCKSR